MSNYSARDHELFNCSESYEHDYVVSLYEDKEGVRDFLKEKCANGEINNMTHDEVYALIKRELGLNRGKK